MEGARPVRAPRGTTLTAQSWATEAPLRMLQNNLDPEVAERPDDLVVYGGTGRAARDWRSFDAMVRTLTTLRPDETMLVQSGRPVGVMQTHEWAPRVLIANSNLVPKWATWEKFNELDRKGLMMYGQMTAGSWIYIGSQGIVQGTYETFAEMGRQHYGGDLKDKWILTAGLGGMGGAQPLAAVMAGAHCIAVECQESSIEKRLATRYVDHRATSIDEALEIIRNATKPTSVGLLGNAAEVLPEMVARGIRPDAVTDLARIFWNQLRILGSTMGSNDEFHEVASLFRAGKLKPAIDQVFDAPDAVKAYQRLESAEQFGKIILGWQ